MECDRRGEEEEPVRLFLWWPNDIYAGLWQLSGLLRTSRGISLDNVFPIIDTFSADLCWGVAKSGRNIICGKTSTPSLFFSSLDSWSLSLSFRDSCREPGRDLSEQKYLTFMTENSAGSRTCNCLVFFGVLLEKWMDLRNCIFSSL